MNVSLDVRPIAINGKDKNSLEPNSSGNGKIIDSSVEEESNLSRYAVEQDKEETYSHAKEQQMVWVVQRNSVTGTFSYLLSSIISFI